MGIPLLRGGAARAALLVTAVATAWVASPRAGRAAIAPVETGTIEGSVRLVTASSRKLASAGAYPSRAVVLAADHNTSEFANVVVSVKFRPTPSAPRRAAIRQADEEFVPHLVAVTTGSSVEFPNDDLVFHNVFSLSRADTFDLGRYPQGHSKSRTFDVPGLVKVFCHLHSQMSAIIRVFDHPYFAIHGAQGQFSITLPAGEYDVAAWHERVGEVNLHASVTAGRATTLTFSLPLTDAR
jgi:plastocyanin